MNYNFDLQSLYRHDSFEKATNLLSQRTSKQSTPSNLSRSPSAHANFPSTANAAFAAEVNRRDGLGRTLLHLVCSNTQEKGMKWLQLLLSVQGIAINAADTESGWTSLHRAMYAGNIGAAILLLRRDDTDPTIKDNEGLSAFEIYNSTIDSTNPSLSAAFEAAALEKESDASSPSEGRTAKRKAYFAPRSELYTWGSNRNFVLGFVGDGDRVAPERVQLNRIFREDLMENGASGEVSGKGKGKAVGLRRWEPVRVMEIGMGRLHSAIATDEPGNGVRLCGYATSGRLGPLSQTQFTFAPLPSFPYSIAHVCLSPDHTLIITSDGDVYTFGLNRFSQLGYVIDAPTPNRHSTTDEPIQTIPKRVLGMLKKEFIIGGAVSRNHSVVFSESGIYTWGTNKGQLGYVMPPVAGNASTSTQGNAQILPRKVTGVDKPIQAVTAIENATALLLKNGEVIILWKEGYFKLQFELERFNRGIKNFRPASSTIDKIAACGNTFAALSNMGDVFTIVMDAGFASSSNSTSSFGSNSPKPQRIWSLRRKFNKVTDIGVGLDGTIIICTISGHVFIRTKKFDSTAFSNANSGGALVSRGTATPPTNPSSSSGGGGWKFKKVPHLQRVVQVAANSTGAFAAIREDVPLKEIVIEGASLAAGLRGVLSFWKRGESMGKVDLEESVVAGEGTRRRTTRADTNKKTKATEKSRANDGYEDEDEGEVDEKIEKDVFIILRLIHILHKWDADFESPILGTDVLLPLSSGKQIPLHRSILALRSDFFASSINALPPSSDLAALLLVYYLYTDELPAVWDSRILYKLREALPKGFALDAVAIKADLVALSKELGLEKLEACLSYHVKTIPAATLETQCEELFDQIVRSDSPTPHSSLPPADVILDLADREVPCHSVILRARCYFFETFFDDADWTLERRTEEVMRTDMSHLSWEVMELVLRNIYTDQGIEMFDFVDRPSADEYIDFTASVMAASNELMLDKLKLVCSAVLRSFVTLHNVCSILAEAAFYEAPDLFRICLYFLASSMETVLESHLLDDLPPDLINSIAKFVQDSQAEKMPISRSNFLVNELMDKHAIWLTEQDIARPTGGERKFRLANTNSGGKSPVLSPSMSPRIGARRSPNPSPALQPLREDAPFEMDDFLLDSSAPPPAPSATRNGVATNGGVTANGRGVVQSKGSTSPSASSFMVLGSPPPSRLQPWSKTDTVSQPLDLRSIMAAESSSTPRRPRPATDGLGLSTPSPTVRRASTPQTWATASSTTESLPAVKFSLASIQSEQALSSASRIAQPPPVLSRAAPTFTPAASSSSTPLSNSPRSHIITPVRLPSRQSTPTSTSRASGGGGGGRNNSGGFKSADIPWTNYIVAPSPPPLSTSFPPPSSSSYSPHLSPTRTPPAQAPSFLSIQSQQSALNLSIKTSLAPRSFASVMRDEAMAAEEVARELQERNEEIEFARWWDEEAARMAGEIEGTAHAPSGGAGGVGTGGGGRGRGGGKKKSNRGGSNRGGRGGIATPSAFVPSTTSTPLSADAVVFVGATPNRGGGGGNRGAGRNRGNSTPNRGGRAVAS